MSKSYGNAINISMTAEETAKRIKKSQTDGERTITFDPEARPGVSGLLSTAAICTGRSEVEIAEEIGMGGAGALKKYVTDDVRPHCDGALETTGMDGAFEELVERYLEA